MRLRHSLLSRYHLCPVRTRLRALHGSRDKRHPFNAIFDGRKIEIVRKGLAVYLSLNRSSNFDIDICKGFDKSLRMPYWKPCESLCNISDVIRPSTENLSRRIRKLY